LLTLEAATGYGIGVFWGSFYAVPASAVGVYVTSIFLYINGPESFISVGGASESLVAFQPILSRQVAQVLFYLCATGLVLLVTGRLLRGASVRELLVTIVVGASVVVTAAWLLQFNSDRFTPAASQVECRRADPVVCVSPGYARMTPPLSELAHTVWGRLAVLDVQVPRRLDQTAQPGEVTSAPLDASVIENPTKESLANAVPLANIAKSYNVMATPSLMKSFSIASRWLQQAADGTIATSSPDRDSLSKGRTLRQQAMWINHTLTALRTCA